MKVNGRNRLTGRYLNKAWNIGAKHALYIHDGHWYHQLNEFPGAFNEFPGAFIDKQGYVIFNTKSDYDNCAQLGIGKQVSIRKPGISGIPGYIRVSPDLLFTDGKGVSLDVDIHDDSGGTEGRRRLITHLRIERNRSLVDKKKSVNSPECEVCGMSFGGNYGPIAAGYCEVHHLKPLAMIEPDTRTLLSDLAIVCANCHRVIHLKNPPYTIEEVRDAIMARNRS